MNRIKLAIFGLFSVMVVPTNAMNSISSYSRYEDRYYVNLHRAISHGYPWTFMETLNEMEAAGHSLDGDDYDALKAHAKTNEFDKFGIMEDPVYQRLSAATLKDDVANFTDHFGNMLQEGFEISDDYLYWLLDLAKRKGADNMHTILLHEFERRGLSNG